MSNNNWKEELSNRFSHCFLGQNTSYKELEDFVSNLLKEASLPVEQERCDAMGHYGGFPKPEGICPKCGRGWDLTKEENNISQLQEVSPASSEGNSIEQVKNFMAHAYFQGALDRAEKKASEAAFNNWYILNKDAFLLNQGSTDERSVELKKQL